MTESDGYLRFAHENIGCIVDEYENATIRVGLDRDIQPGDLVELRSPKDRVFGYAEIEDVYESQVGKAFFDAVFVDKRKHPASSDDDLLSRLRLHYGEDVMYDTDVTVVYFNVTELRMPRELRSATEQRNHSDGDVKESGGGR